MSMPALPSEPSATATADESTDEPARRAVLTAAYFAVIAILIGVAGLMISSYEPLTGF